jgi:hypothetical protein
MCITLPAGGSAIGGKMTSGTQAPGRIRRRKRYACRTRDCDRVFDIDGISSHLGPPKKGVCPDHPESGVMKVWVQEQVKPGLVDWPAVQVARTSGRRL